MAPYCHPGTLELLLQSAHPGLHPLVKRCGGGPNLCKELVELLRRAAAPSDKDKDKDTGSGVGTLPCAAEELASLGERALELDELEDIVRWQWQGTEQQAAHKKLLCCGIDSPHALLRALSNGDGQCPLNRLLTDAGFKGLRPETISELSKELEVRIRQRVEVCVEGQRPTLVTAPHNIYLQRDGQSPHVMEEYTTLIAQRLARQLAGTCITWNRTEQRRSELLWFLARRHLCEDEAGSYLDPKNRDPNYLAMEEVMSNSWFQQMSRVADGWRCNRGLDVGLRPILHIDVHGCRDPPHTPSHLTVGLAAMRHQADRGAGSLTLAQVNAFGAALESELSAALSGLDLRPRAPLVRVLFPALPTDREAVAASLHLSGAWAPEERRLTQSQQAVGFAGFTHSCQLELSKSLRKIVSRDETAACRFGRAVNSAWLSCLGSQLPALPAGPGTPSGGSPAALRRSQSSAVGPPRSTPPGNNRQSCPAKWRQAFLATDLRATRSASLSSCDPLRFISKPSKPSSPRFRPNGTKCDAGGKRC